MQIAQEIDRKEREVMAEGGIESEEYKKFIEVCSFMLFVYPHVLLGRITQCFARWKFQCGGNSRNTMSHRFYEYLHLLL